MAHGAKRSPDSVPSPSSFSANESRTLPGWPKLLHKTPNGGRASTSRCAALHQPPEALKIRGPVHVGKGPKDRANKPAAQKAFQCIAKSERTSPADVAESATQSSPLLLAQANQVVASIRAGAQDGVTRAQLAQRLHDQPGGQFRRVRADDHRGGVATKKELKRSLQPRAEILAALPLAGISGEGWREYPAGEEKVAPRVLPDAIHFSQRVRYESGMKLRRPGRAEKGDEAGLGGAGQNGARKNGDRRKRPPRG
jgi:hypothetical protein